MLMLMFGMSVPAASKENVPKSACGSEGDSPRARIA
jgi:hypothetical protein